MSGDLSPMMIALVNLSGLLTSAAVRLGFETSAYNCDCCDPSTFFSNNSCRSRAS